MMMPMIADRWQIPDPSALLQIARLLTVKREREIKQGIDQRTSRSMERCVHAQHLSLFHTETCSSTGLLLLAPRLYWPIS